MSFAPRPSEAAPAMPVARSCPFDPPPELGALRERSGLARVRTLKGDSAWLVTRYDDVREVLCDRRFSSSPRAPGYPSYIAGEVPPPRGFFMQWDDPEHSRLRLLVAREFIARHIETMRPAMQATVEAAVDAFLAGPQPADLIAGLAYPVAFRNICALVGVPTADQDFVQATVDALLDRDRPAAEAEAAAVALMGYFHRIVGGKAADPGEDLIGRLASGPLARRAIDAEELVGITALILLGGYDTMVQVIGLGVLKLLEAPDHLQAFLADPKLGEPLVDELVRYLSVNHAGLPRAATEDVEIGGQPIRKGEGVLVMINAGNRDACAFADPDAFDLARDARGHVGFGHGLHKCIGAPFAKAELPMVFRTLFTRAPDLRLAQAADQLRFRDRMVLYGVRELPVAW